MTTQITLFDDQPSTARLPEYRFNGADYVPERDNARLTGQIRDIFELMRDGQWRTLPQIERTTGHPPASISAQLRHLRKKRWGSHTVEREYISNGLYQYRLTVNAESTVSFGG